MYIYIHNFHGSCPKIKMVMKMQMRAVLEHEDISGVYSKKTRRWYRFLQRVFLSSFLPSSD